MNCLFSPPSLPSRSKRDPFFFGVACVGVARGRVGVGWQEKHLLMGFYDVIDEPLLSVFDFQELELLLCGMPDIDCKDWQAHTEYMGEYEKDGKSHKCVKMFWDVVENDFTSEQRARYRMVVGPKASPAASACRGLCSPATSTAAARPLPLPGLTREPALPPSGRLKLRGSGVA